MAENRGRGQGRGRNDNRGAMMTTLFDSSWAQPRPGGRRCGDCTLCCKLLPVRELHKKGGERCQHQKAGKGCGVYNKPAMPPSCGLWSCRWLVQPDETAEL